MQQRPTAAELLADISALLGQVIDQVPEWQKHQVRVAANLANIVEREVTLGPTNDEAERTRLAALLEQPATTDLATLREQLLTRLNDPTPLDPAESVATYDALLDTVRADLAISKPGYADWTQEET
ncbi:MAG TPA: DUF6285 domain-containing protein [Acidimicrobiales bacterium]|nr:DUF6285 domain-containing protein [Acidimicrobiales bacterium]